MTNDIEETIKELIAEQAGINVDRIALASLLVDDLGLDSIDLIELIMAIEERFDTGIDDDALADINTVEEVVAVTKQHLSGSDNQAEAITN